MESLTRMTVLTVVGARPQFIKAAVVSRAIREAPGLREVLVHTGQHYDRRMSDVFFDELELPDPSYNLEVGSGTHGAQTGRMLEALESVLLTEKPDWVLVYGDTNSTLAGALAAVKLHIPVAHVEAGLRSLNRRMPEEVNRVLTDHASDLLFAPTQAAVDNLRLEGIPEARVRLVGDVMYDAALYYGRKADRQSRVLTELGLTPGSYVLSTIHRAENTDDPVRLRAIFLALARVAEAVPVVVPLHPRTREALAQLGFLEQAAQRIRLIAPAGYLDMTHLERNAQLVVTDSGGVQKEAFFHRVPCVTLRDETEWVELVETGWNTLVPPTDPDHMAANILSRCGMRGREVHLYGDGSTAGRIVFALMRRE